MTGEVPQQARTLSDLETTLQGVESVVDIDTVSDDPDDLSFGCSWAEILCSSLIVPHAVEKELAKSDAIGLYDIEHKNDHTIVIVVEVNR